MDKLALMTVGIFMMAGVHISANTQSNLLEADQRLSEDQYEILTRNAAVAGLDRAKQLLSEEFQNYAEVEGSNDGVSYTVNATTFGNVAVVRTTGSQTMSDGTEVNYNVRTEFRRRLVLPPEAPPNMRYAVISDEDLVLRGNIEGDVYVDGEADNTLNANMHTNRNLQVNGNAAMVHGFGTYCLTANPSVESLLDNFVPNDNGSDADHVYQTGAVEILPMVPSDIAASGLFADVQVSEESVELAGSYTFGTRDNPHIWHIKGNLTVQNGNTTINGYVMFLVDGSVDVRGNARVGDSGYDGGNESSIALYTGAGVRLRGNSEFWGQIYSNGGIEFNSGNPTIYGSVTTKGEVDFRGRVTIYYRKASPALTTPFQPNLFMLDPIAYSEW